MPIRFAVLLLSVSLALTALAAPVSIDPPNPDSKTSITVWMGGLWTVACTPRDPKVAVVGDVINVIFTTGRVCGQLVRSWGGSAKIGTLAPGTYRIHAFAFPTDGTIVDPPVTIGDLTFTVSQAEAPFTIVPNAALIGGGQTVTITSTDVPLAQPVLFGEAQSPSVTKISDFQLRAVVPPHAAGAVTVTANGFPAVNAFRYYDPNGAADEAVFETILVPMLYDGPGAFGSKWTTDLFVRNESALPLMSFKPLVPGTIAAGSTVKVVASPDLPQNGLIFRPLRQQSGTLSFSARVRDTSRDADDFGSEMPIVRESQLRRGRLVLPDVVVDPRYRTTLRIYGVDDIPSGVDVTLTGDGITAGSFFLHPTRGPGDQPWTLTFDSSSLIAKPAPSGHYAIVVSVPEANSRIWAMASITNNATQHVTLVTPQ